MLEKWSEWSGLFLAEERVDFFETFGKFVVGSWVRNVGGHEAFLPAGFFLADGFRQNGAESRVERAAVVFGNPAGELKNFGRNLRMVADDFIDALKGGTFGGRQERGN